MKKILQYTLLVLVLIVCQTPADATRSCLRDTQAEINYLTTEFDACRNGCADTPSPAPYCADYCQTWYDLQIEDAMVDYSICVNSIAS